MHHGPTHSQARERLATVAASGDLVLAVAVGLMAFGPVLLAQGFGSLRS